MAADAFPTPREGDDGLPNWAWAIVAAGIGVTVLWIIAIVILILFEIRRVRTDGGREDPQRVFRQLSSPPPPVPPPERRSPSSQRSSIRSSGGAGAAEPSKHHLEVPDTEQFEVPEKEFNLREVKRDSDASSTSSEESIEGGTQVESKSVRTHPERTTPLEQTNLSGDERSPSSARSSPSQGGVTGMVLSRPVTVRQLGATIREPGYIESEFRKLPNPMVGSEDIPPGAERKNRYSNVLPTPKTRVPLKMQFGRPNSEYINANYIRGYRNTPKQYIATQGPMDNTVEDFWRMVWENDSEVIVMATNFQERGIDKCARYWPAQGSEEYGNLEVTLLQQSAHENYNEATLELRDVESGAVRTIRHYRLTCWPHQGVPKATKPITDFLREIKMADSSGPAVVHCSAGIGRTGVLIAIDVGIQGILQGDPKIDILRIVSTLRQDRAGMVQTRDQYRFIHTALYDTAREVGPQS